MRLRCLVYKPTVVNMAAAEMEFTGNDDSDDDTPQLAAGGGEIVYPRISDKQYDDAGNWLPKGELRKKKSGKGWKKRYCCIVSEQAAEHCQLPRLFSVWLLYAG